jgi:phosphoglycerate dehydrogenase-like enzyme
LNDGAHERMLRRMKVVFAGTFAVQLAEPVRARLSVPCDVITTDEAGVTTRLSDADVLVSMGFTREMAAAAPRLRLVQVPGAGLDRIDRGALRPGLRLANAYGHEAGIAEYIIGAMIALTRSFARLDAKLRQGRWESQWAIGAPAPPLWPELTAKTLGILGFGHIGEARRRLSGDHAVAVAADARPHRRAPPWPDEAHRLSRQRRPRRDRRRACALPGAGLRKHCGRGARRLVSLSDRGRTDAAGDAAFP